MCDEYNGTMLTASIPVHVAGQQTMTYLYYWDNYQYKYTKQTTCHNLLDGFWIGFIDILYTQLITTINYSTITISTLYS
jgi:hypothetical protein